MSRFVYCQICKNGFLLEINKNRICKCKNVRGRYINPQEAVVWAKTPEMARLVGIDRRNPKLS